MLNAEAICRYLVYPSWARSFTFTWAMLPEMLSRPLESKHLEVNTLAAVEAGFMRPDCGEWSLIPGARGNGIIRYAAEAGKTWLGACLFFNEADTHTLHGVRARATMNIANVGTLVLRGDAWLRLWGEGKKKPREYECNATIEHLDEADEDIYWIIEMRSRRSGTRRAATNQLNAAAASFPLRLDFLPQPPDRIRAAVASWFYEDNSELLWWQVRSDQRGSGMHLAMAAYSAFAWNEDLTGKIKSIHVVARVEGQPNSRPVWGGWPP